MLIIDTRVQFEVIAESIRAYIRGPKEALPEKSGDYFIESRDVGRIRVQVANYMDI